MNTLKKKTTIVSDIFFLLKYIWKFEKNIYSLNFIQIIFNAINPLISVIFLKYIMDEILNNQTTKKLFLLILSMCFLLLIVNGTLKILSPIFEEKKTILHYRFIQKIGDCAEKMAYEDLEKTLTKNLLELSKDTNNFLNIVEALTSSLSNLVSLISLSVIIIVIEPFFLIPLGAVIVTQIILNVIYQRMMNDEWRTNIIGSLRMGRYISSLLEKPMYGKEIRVNNLQKWLYTYSNKKFTKYVEYAYQSSKKASIFLIIQILVLASVFVLLMFYLAGNIINGELNTSDAVVALTAVVSIANIGEGFSNSISEVIRSAVFVKDFRKCTELADKTSNGNKAKTSFLSNIDIKIEFKNVSFHYPDSEKLILKNFSMTIKENEKVALVGLNGAGKTTIIKLLCRFYEPSKGTIYFNGIDIKKIPLDEYYRNIAAVFQDYKIFAFSIKENITFSENNINIAKLNNAIEKSGLLHKIENLKNGIETIYSQEFDEFGEKFSGGESQKLAIARAFYKDTPVIMLDEPTASLDAVAEFEIYCTFNKLVENKTAIFISHRLSSTRFCDKIYVIKDGSIIESGTHEKLLSNSESLYSQMFNAQAAHYLENI